MQQEFNAFLDCPECLESFPGLWLEDLIDGQQLDAAPVAHQECPYCGHIMKEAIYPGWTFFGEAG